MASTKREIAKSVKSLIVMLQSLKGQQVTINLRNDTLVHGTVMGVDADMNIELENATIEPDKFYCTDDMQQQKFSSPVELVTVQSLDSTTDKGDWICVRGRLIDRNPKITLPDRKKSTMVVTLPDEAGEFREEGAIASINDHHDVDDEARDGDSKDETFDNLIVKDSQKSTTLDYLVVKGLRIRHLDLPNDIDLLQSTREEISRMRNRRRQWSKRDIIRS